MKIQRLHIFNIASIVDATIDFTAQPLCDSDVYLITGDTGAGKTTILDSICLALFNNTPRLNKGKLTKVKNDIDNLTLKDPRRLMRRNTGEAMVELYFEAKGREFKVEWQVQRGKKKKASVAVDNVCRCFTNLSTNETLTSVGTKDAELQAKIHEVIGLDFDQFCRTTMLAQNEFTKFLSSDEDDRAGILEKITQTSEFSAVGAKVFELTSLKKAAWEKAQQEASDTGFSEEKIQEKKEQLQTLSAETEGKKAEREAVEKKMQWIKKEEELTKAVEAVQAAYDTAHASLTSEKYQSDCLFVEQWNASIEARKWLVEAINAYKESSAQEQELAHQKDSIQRVMNGYQYAREEVEEYQQELDSINAFLEENASKADTFSNVQTIAAHIDTIVTKNGKKKELECKISDNEKLRNEKLIPARDTAKTVYESEQKKLKAIDDEIDAQEKALNALQLPSIRKESEQTKDLIRNVEKAIDAVKAIHTAEETYNQETKRLTASEQELDLQEKQFKEEILPVYEQAKIRKEASEQARNLLRDSVDKFAKQMRTHLTVGCECPVCRQRIETLPLEHEIDEIYQEAERKFKKAKEAFENAETAKNKLESCIATERKRLNEDQEKHAKDKSVETAKNTAITACKLCGLEMVEEGTQEQLCKLQQEKTDYIHQVLTVRIKEGEVMEQNLNDLRRKQKHQTTTLERSRTDFEKAEQQIRDINFQITSDRNLSDGNMKEVESAKNSVCPLIGKANWTHDWTQEPVLFKNELVRAAQEYVRKANRQGELKVKIGPLKENNDKIRSIIEQIFQRQPSWKELTPVKFQQDQLFEKANALLQKVESILTSLRNAQNRLKENSECLKAFLTAHPSFTKERLQELNQVTSITELAMELEKKRQEPGQKKVLWNKAKEEHSEHQQEKPELKEEETLEELHKRYMEADTEISRLNQQMGIIDNELAEDAQKKKDNAILQEKAEKARKEYGRWQRLNRLIGDKEGKTFRTIAQSYIFDNLLHSANAYLQKLEPRYTLKTVPGTLYSALEDAHQGFASRDTSSLSGGESFLVSLALALALSDIGQGLSVDTLFIDEGFGSLSGRPLTNAINTLRTLRGKNGRHVGIISHIQEVRENIPVQIQVRRSSDNSSSTIDITQ